MESSHGKSRAAAILKYKGDQGFTPLHFAARHGATGIVRLLVVRENVRSRWIRTVSYDTRRLNKKIDA